jgi:hypothetical protein
MMHIVTEKAGAMMIDFRAAVQFWREAVNTAVFLNQ